MAFLFSLQLYKRLLDIQPAPYNRMVDVKTFDVLNGHIQFQMFIHSKSVEHIRGDRDGQIAGLGDCVDRTVIPFFRRARWVRNINRAQPASVAHLPPSQDSSVLWPMPCLYLILRQLANLKQLRHINLNLYTPLLPKLTETYAINCIAYSAGVVW